MGRMHKQKEILLLAKSEANPSSSMNKNRRKTFYLYQLANPSSVDVLLKLYA